MKLVDIGVSKSPAGNSVRVRVPPAAPIEKRKACVLAYIVGVALGDGNLSCPNGRVTRLRITCDKKYPVVAREIRDVLSILLPTNRISIVPRKSSRCFDISVYSNKLNGWLPWKVGLGSKARQKARVPDWIFTNRAYVKNCLKGLIQTDGCMYMDRGYPMVNFTNNTYELAQDVRSLMENIGFIPSFMKVKIGNDRYKYTVRIARNTNEFTETLQLYKK